MTSDEAFASPHFLNGTLGLTGEPNNPATLSKSNEPGLDNESNVPSTKGVAVKSTHWIIIIVILVALFGFLSYYFYSTVA